MHLLFIFILLYYILFHFWYQILKPEEALLPPSHIPALLMFYIEAGSCWVAEGISKLLRLSLNSRFSCICISSHWDYGCIPSHLPFKCLFLHIYFYYTYNISQGLKNTIWEFSVWGLHFLLPLQEVASRAGWGGITMAGTPIPALLGGSSACWMAILFFLPWFPCFLRENFQLAFPTMN